VEPIKPVKVEISLDSRNESSRLPHEKEQSVAVVAEQKRTEKKIEAGISAAWNVPGDAVRITWANAGEEG
jgi:stage III sporulation protein AF